ncbi:somatostatin receptor type 5-like [Paramacrobiotus metropolitanus]|uniref:somatostatin receptor type 5-like n=1 Tax=Paramacrobiotus metropolitanus TaxID=2943436 RepID=UPI002445A283|nr:somatostatin receptor type 5-like [Paramacrobiotus metropolitanus]
MNRSDNFSISNSTNTIELLYESAIRRNVFLIIASILCGITCILTTLLIIVFIRQRSQGPKLLILHQLLTEAQLTMLHWPLYNLAFLLSQYGYYFPTVFCRYYLLLYMTNLTAGLWGLFILALNRLIAIGKPHFYERWNSPPVNIAMIAGCWLIGLCSYLYFFLGGEGGLAPVAPFGLCNFVQPGLRLVIANIFGSYLPLLLTTVIYIPLLCKRRQRVAEATTAVVGESQRKKQKLTRMLFGMAVVHVVCFSSVPVLNSFFPGFYSRDPMARVWMRQVFCLGYLSTPISAEEPWDFFSGAIIR